MVDYIYKSWLKVQQRLQQKLDRQVRWLPILKSDEELVKESNVAIETIRSRATAILESYETGDRLFNTLFEAYRNEQDTLTHTALDLLRPTTTDY